MSRNMYTLVFGYWTSLWRLKDGRKEIIRILDTPLDGAVVRSKLTAVWSTTILFLTILLIYSPRIYTFFMSKALDRWMHLAIWLAPLAAALIIIIGSSVFYSTFRLYTLIAHHLTTNLLKTRGQRLRLLNAETAILPLLIPLSLGYVLYLHLPITGLFLMIATTVYSITLLGQAYNLIFHKTAWRGTVLWCASTAVTMFVLCVGILAIAVSLGILVIVVLLILRGLVA